MLAIEILKNIGIYQYQQANKRYNVRSTSHTERDPEEGVGRGEGSSNRGNVRMFRFRDSGPGDGQRARFSGISESQKRRLRQVSLRSEFIDGHEYQLVSRHDNLKVIPDDRQREPILSSNKEHIPFGCTFCILK